MSTPFFGVEIPRLCQIWRTSTSEFAFDESLVDGFRNESSETKYTLGTDIAPDLPVIVLGEPGIGKSTLIRQMTDCRSPHWLNGAEFSEGALKDEIMSFLDQVDEQSDEEAHPLLVIDQLDECGDLNRLGPILKSVFRRRSANGCQLIFGCRATDWNATVQRALDEIAGECQLVNLAPLSRTEASQLCDNAGVSGAELVAEAIRLEAGFLASVPLTLEMLVRIWRKDRSLASNSRTLFAAAVNLLVEEYSEDRSVRKGVLTADQRLAVAGAIAAHVLLTGKRTIWTGKQHLAEPNDFLSDALVGLTFAHGPGVMTITGLGLEETIATPLFTHLSKDRVNFRHSSLAAYLTAVHLKARHIPPEQLRSLFLNAASDGTRGIPESLRETASWLAALSPEKTAWIAEADPASIAAHSQLVDSPHVRSVLVSALLDNALETELTDRGWFRARWQLNNPGIPDQIGPILARATISGPSTLFGDAQVRMALRIAGEVNTAGLAEQLVNFAEDSRWPAFLRGWAIKAVEEESLCEYADRLTVLLEVTASNPEQDDDDELRARLLNTLYPKILAVGKILKFLVPRKRRNLIGGYSAFLRDFAESVGDDDLPQLLTWAVSDSSRQQPGEDLAADAQASANVGMMPIPIEILESIPERVLSSGHASKLVVPLAEAIGPLFEQNDRVTIPRALDRPDSDIRATQLRRDLAIAMASISDSIDPSWEILSGWSADHDRAGDPQFPGRSSLLGSSDFEWAASKSRSSDAKGDNRLEERIGRIAIRLFDRNNPSHVQVIYNNQHGTIWNWFESSFEAIEIYGPKAMTERHYLWMEQHQPEWEGAEEWRAHIADLIDTAARDEPNAIWHLAWNLQFDPQTGQSERGKFELYSEFTAFKSLPSDQQAMVRSKLMTFIQNDDDGSSSWLGTDRTPIKGAVGYWALAQMLADDGKLTADVLSNLTSWVGVLIWAQPYESLELNYKATLLEIAADKIPTQLADSLSTHLRGHLHRGSWSNHLTDFDFRWAPQLVEVAKELADTATTTIRSAGLNERDNEQEHGGGEQIETTGLTAPNDLADGSSPSGLPDEAVSNILAIVDQIFEGLWSAEYAWVADFCLSILLEARQSSAWERLQSIAGRSLLLANVDLYWSGLRDLMLTSPNLSRAIAGETASRRRETPTKSASSDTIGEMYEWLAELFPVEDDSYLSGWVSVKDEVRDWRASLLNQLGDRSDPASLAELLRLSRKRPANMQLRVNLARARVNAQALLWDPPAITDLIAVLADSRKRLVQNEDELCDLVVQILREIEKDLKIYGEFLWDRSTHEGQDLWEPKYESSISAYLKQQIDLRIGVTSGVVSNREVVVRPTDSRGSGERVDLLVQAKGSDTVETISVVIEVKGSWNSGLVSSLRTQLVERYLPAVGTEVGVYFIGWFPLDQWSRQGSRKPSKKRPAVDAVSDSLNESSRKALLETGKRVSVIVAEIPRPIKANSDQQPVSGS